MHECQHVSFAEYGNKWPMVRLGGVEEESVPRKTLA